VEFILNVGMDYFRKFLWVQVWDTPLRSNPFAFKAVIGNL
jgi:hypothetical protein